MIPLISTNMIYKLAYILRMNHLLILELGTSFFASLQVHNLESPFNLTEFLVLPLERRDIGLYDCSPWFKFPKLYLCSAVSISYHAEQDRKDIGLFWPLTMIQIPKISPMLSSQHLVPCRPSCWWFSPSNIQHLGPSQAPQNVSLCVTTTISLVMWECWVG